MRIVIAPDKFKGCLDAAAVAAAIARGARLADPAAEVEHVPMADGGEGTVDALIAATGGRRMTTRVTGPLPDMKIDAHWGMLGDGRTAVIEMAAASGLALLRPDQYDPLATTTYGTGELLLAAANMGAQTVILGIGGSATVDAGIGCAQACGFDIQRGMGGPPMVSRASGSFDSTAALPLVGCDVSDVISVTRPSTTPLDHIQIIVASDVTNPLAGPNGAAAVFGPQKGATPAVVAALDHALAHLAERTGKQAQADAPGAGAAGGLGFAMLAWFGATLRSGLDVVAQAVNLRQRLANADLVITGEGRLDASSLHGKTAIGIARLCKELEIPCIALAGAIGEGADAVIEQGITAYFSICDRPLTLDAAMADAPRLLAAAAANAVRAMIWRRPD